MTDEPFGADVPASPPPSMLAVCQRLRSCIMKKLHKGFVTCMYGQHVKARYLEQLTDG